MTRDLCDYPIYSSQDFAHSYNQYIPVPLFMRLSVLKKKATLLTLKDTHPPTNILLLCSVILFKDLGSEGTKIKLMDIYNGYIIKTPSQFRKIYIETISSHINTSLLFQITFSPCDKIWFRGIKTKALYSIKNTQFRDCHERTMTLISVSTCMLKSFAVGLTTIQMFLKQSPYFNSFGP